MSSELLPCITVGPAGPVDASIVWLHGLGADGHDFEGLVPELPLGELRCRFILPHAPSRPVTLNGGLRMPAWYDLGGMNLRRDQDEEGIRASATQIRALLEREEERGVPSERIFLAGFSQGGALALFEGLRYPRPLAGIISLSAYLLMEDSLEKERSDANAAVSIFLAHGKLDPVVPIEMGSSARDRLQAAGHPVHWESYSMPHAVCPEEIQDIGGWMRSRIPQVSSQ